ncbi:pectin lyase-like protein [Aspergillus ellipticus CBS 707.79]|uniref:pectin lyase n=1 Tax=Aspergillus ellipticus CBS 707.79 TaxID=1448320 RepID=A0A319CXI3_9EURO|nr:pectin lyase-like protein [Aspergillus ellipticus CBS 707.79]
MSTLSGSVTLGEAVSVSGQAEGFAAGVTGGGSSEPQYTSNINKSSLLITATWYTAALKALEVASNKTIISVGESGVIKGKGLSFTNGASNIIIQNIQIDHITTARTGRQHHIFGFQTNTRVTLSNNYIDGDTPYSTGCDRYTYWIFKIEGFDDQITLQNNYIYKTSGRSPALSSSTLLHTVNNIWYLNNGHALEGGNTIIRDYNSRLFDTPDLSTADDCECALSRTCEVNILTGSGSLTSYTNTSFFSDFSDLTIAPATSASKAEKNVPNNAGISKL